MRPWAESVGEQKLFRRFERGERLRSDDWQKYVRPLARQVASALGIGRR